MSLFDKIDAYLDKFDIELTDEDLYLDNRLGIDENDNIYKWNFPGVAQPSIEMLNQLSNDEVKENKAQKKIQKILKSFRVPAINSNILKIKNLNKFDGCLFYNLSSKRLNFILDGKVIIL